ncbi:MAG: zf-HC2 domain-containing protein [Treponema sp.]|nr:zf-HC2 domain-containing protein [Treponema sp.]
MFTCPNKDLHSVYLDGELSAEYKAKYEEHVKNCPKCQAALKKLEAARDLLKADSETITMSERDMASSFERLQSRLSYKKILKPLTMSDGAKSVFKDVLVGASAAAVIAAVIPAKTKTVIQQVAQSDFKPVARMTSLDMPAEVQVEGSVTPASVVGFLADENTRALSRAQYTGESLPRTAMPFDASVLANSPEVDVAAPVLGTTVAIPHAAPALTSYDVFLPVEAEDAKAKEKQSGFFLHLSSPLFTIDIEKKE